MFNWMPDLSHMVSLNHVKFSWHCTFTNALCLTLYLGMCHIRKLSCVLSHGIPLTHACLLCVFLGSDLHWHLSHSHHAVLPGHCAHHCHTYTQYEQSWVARYVSWTWLRFICTNQKIHNCSDILVAFSYLLSDEGTQTLPKCPKIVNPLGNVSESII